MGLFDFLKKNKDIITDNGINYLHYKNGKGNLKEKFNKIDGILHGEYIRYYESGGIDSIFEYNKGNGKKVLFGKEKELFESLLSHLQLLKDLITKFIELDNFFLNLSGINLILQMRKHTLSEYASLLNNKFPNQFNQEFLEVYLFYKRNYFITRLLRDESIILIDENQFNNYFSSNLLEINEYVENRLNSNYLKRERFNINYSMGTEYKSHVISKLLQSDNSVSPISLFVPYLHNIYDERNLPNNFVPRIKYEESVLFGIKPTILLLIKELINELPDIQVKTLKTGRKNFNLLEEFEILDADPEDSKEFYKVHLQFAKHIESILDTCNEKQDDKLLDTITSYINENNKYSEFNFINF